MLLDLISIKTILSSFSRPLLIFASFAGVSAVIGLAFLVAGITQHTDNPGIIFFSVSVLYTTLALALLMWGVLGELIYRTGDLKLEHFANITSSLKNQAVTTGETGGKHEH